MVEFSLLTTEAINPMTRMIDECSTLEMLELINQQDALVPVSVAKEIPNIARAVDLLTELLRAGGRMIYVGAGTSGRLGVLDASECPPTFGSPREMVQAYIAGGDDALRNAAEGCEDMSGDAEALVERLAVTEADAVIGVSASGVTPYVAAAARKARSFGAHTIGVINNKASGLDALFDICISPVTGPEVIMGSTRMKAGTAQKLVLNMLTTCTMVKLGKVYNNMMVDMRATNYKLRMRSIRIIQTIVDVEPSIAEKALDAADGDTKVAIMMLMTKLDRETVQHVLARNHGILKQALKEVKELEP
ncbi:MAG: N-acetylmuramic acid 6-phosphate etherase [Clostridiales bacterium]|nr:N-acetylmuramic acid 6-phosphate etherase [Clostridiales bacterium]